MIPLYNHQFLCFFMILLSNQHNWSNLIGCALCTLCFFNHESWIIQSWNLVLCVIFPIVCGWNPHIQHNEAPSMSQMKQFLGIRIKLMPSQLVKRAHERRVITYMHIYVRTCVCTDKCIYAYTSLCICICFIYTYMYNLYCIWHVHVYVCVCKGVYIYTQVLRIRVYKCVCTTRTAMSIFW